MSRSKRSSVHSTLRRSLNLESLAPRIMLDAGGLSDLLASEGASDGTSEANPPIVSPAAAPETDACEECPTCKPVLDELDENPECEAEDGRIDLELTKTADLTMPLETQTVTWTLTLRNRAFEGAVAATGVAVADYLPSGVGVVSATADVGSHFDLATRIWSIDQPLEPGGQFMLRIRTRVLPGTAIRPITNRAEVIRADQTDVDSSPDNLGPTAAEDDEAEVSVLASRLSTLSGFSYVDVNNNGVFEPSETPLLGVKVELLGQATGGLLIHRSTFTNLEGRYRFVDLPPGEYWILQAQPKQFVDGLESLGSAGGKITGNDEFTVQLSLNTDATNYNFGERGLISPTKRLFLTSAIERYYQPVDVRQGDLWYVLEPDDREWLEGSARYDAAHGSLNMEMFDYQMEPLPTVPTANGIRWQIPDDQLVYLRLSGDQQSAEVRLRELTPGIYREGDELTVLGTSNADVVQLEITDTEINLDIGAGRQIVPLAGLSRIRLALGTGTDTLYLTGSSADEVLRIDGTSLIYEHPQVTVVATQVERQHVQLGAGTDQLQLTTTSARDRVSELPDAIRIYGQKFVARVSGVDLFSTRPSDTEVPVEQGVWNIDWGAVSGELSTAVPQLKPAVGSQEPADGGGSQADPHSASAATTLTTTLAAPAIDQFFAGSVLLVSTSRLGRLQIA